MNNEQLRQFIERIERLTDEKKVIQEDIKDVYSEAKASGYDPKIMRKIVAMRDKTNAEIQEEEALLELYKQAMGMS